MLLAEPSMGATTHDYGDDAVLACHHAPQVETEMRTKTNTTHPRLRRRCAQRHTKKNKNYVPQVETGMHAKDTTPRALG